MRGFDRVCDLAADRKRLVERNWSLRDPFRERRPLDEFQDERANAVGFFESVDLADVRVVQGGEDLASRRKRARRSGSTVKLSGSTFSATSRLNFLSRARKTSPMASGAASSS